MTNQRSMVIALLGGLASVGLLSAHASTTLTVEPKTWLNDQIIASRRDFAPEIERDALKRLALMDPKDAVVILEELRLIVRYGELTQDDKVTVDKIVSRLCQNDEGYACQEARVLASLLEEQKAQQLSEARLLATAGNATLAVEAYEALFGGRPQEESLLYEYALQLLAIPERHKEGLALLETLARSPSPTIAAEARSKSDGIYFEIDLAQALKDAFNNRRRQKAIPVLEKALRTHPNDERSPRWRRALADARFWVTMDRADRAYNQQAFQKAEVGYRTALRLKPTSPYGYLGLADVSEARGDLRDASRWVERGLTKARNISLSERRMMSDRLTRLKAREARAHAEALAPKVATDRPTAAYLVALEKECRLTNDPWRTRTYADALVTANRIDDAKALFSETVATQNDDWRYVAALFYRSINDNETALRLLAPSLQTVGLNAQPTSRAADCRQLHTDIYREKALSEARTLLQQGDAMSAFLLVEPLTFTQPWQLVAAAEIASQAGHTEAAQRYWLALEQHPEWRDRAILEEVDLFIKTNDTKRRTDALTMLDTWEEDKRHEGKPLSLDLLTRWTTLMTTVGASDIAYARLPYWLDWFAHDTDPTNDRDLALLYRELAMHAEAMGDGRLALEHYRHAFEAAGLATPAQTQSDAAWTLAMRTPDVPCCAKAVPTVDWLDVSLRERAAERYEAEQTILQTGFTVDLDSGKPGWSDLTKFTWMKEARFPLMHGRAVLRADTVHMDVGKLPHGQSAFGFMNVFKHPLFLGKPVNHDTGESIALGWEGEHFGFDIGSTPLGFIYEDVVGGLHWSTDVGPVGITTELYRRAEDGSLLAFGGQRDPLTKLTWGGVRRTGIALNLSLDQGGFNGFWARGEAEKLKGHHVADNHKLALMGGWYLRLIDCPHHERTAGLNLFYWTYDKDLSDYYFGQGGYYSPNQAVSTSFSLEESRRTANLSWWVQGRLGLSWTSSDAHDRYPINKAFLQAFKPNTDVDTANEILGNAVSELNTRDPGESDVGVSAGIRSRLEYRLTPRWILGADFAWQHADDYSPFFAGFWLQYRWSDWQGDLNLPPKPMVPYAEW